MVTVTQKDSDIDVRKTLDNYFSLLSKYQSQLDLPFDLHVLHSFIVQKEWSSNRKVFEDSANRAKLTLRSVLIMYNFFHVDMTDRLVADLTPNMCYLMLLDLYNIQEELLKWSSAYYLAKELKQDIYRYLPNRPVWKRTNRTFLGMMERMLIRLCHSGLEACWSYNAIKRGCPPLRFDNVVKNVAKHAKTMGDDTQADDSIIQNINTVMDRLLGRKLVKVLNKPFQVPTPSLNAGFDSSSSSVNGGNRNFIYHYLNKLVEDYQNQHGADWGNGLLPSTSTLQMFIGERPSPDWDFWENDDALVGDSVEILPEEKEQNISSISDGDLWNLLSRDLIEKYSGDEPAKAGVVALREPFKVRIITKSDSMVNYYGIPLQKKLISFFREDPVFQLMGRPLTLDIINKAYTCVPPSHLLVSGDYSAATDNIYMNVSHAVLSKILSKLNISQESRVVLLKTMMGQNLYYRNTFDQFMDDPTYPSEIKNILRDIKNKNKKNKYTKEDYNRKLDQLFELWQIPKGFHLQKRGQLMGSILSFQVLCLVNFSMFAISVSEFEGIPLESVTTSYCDMKYGLRINGDDISFHASQDFISHWSRVFPRSGLTESVGKNFVSPNKITINSRMYSGIRDKDNKFEWKEVCFVNLGLLLATEDHIVESTNQRKVDLVKSLPAIQREFLRQPENSVRKVNYELFNQFMFFQTNFLGNISGPNWYLPTWVGGLGLECPKDETIIYNKVQHTVATLALTRNSVEDVRKFKILSNSLSLPMVTSQLIQLTNEVSNVLEPVVVMDVEDQEDEIMTELMSFSPFTNLLSPHDLLIKKKGMSDYEYVRNIKSITKRFSKLVSFSSLNLLSDEKMQNLNTLNRPTIHFRLPFNLKKHVDTVTY